MKRRLRRSVRPTDTVARMDGDLFAVLMRYTDVDNYKQSAVERVREGINQRPFKTSTGDMAVSATVGVVFYRGDEELISAKEMINRAMAKLSEAIDMGNDSVAY